MYIIVLLSISVHRLFLLVMVQFSLPCKTFVLLEVLLGSFEIVLTILGAVSTRILPPTLTNAL
jgi:hypothetical protein